MQLGDDLDRKEGTRGKTYSEDKRHKQYFSEL